MSKYLSWERRRGDPERAGPEVPRFVEEPEANAAPVAGAEGTIPPGWLEAAEGAGQALTWSGGAWGPQYGERIETAGLVDPTDGEYFDANAASAPAGWAEVAAANVASRTDELYSFWYLAANGASLSWKYRKQTGYTIESLPDNYWLSATFGPVFFRDGRYPDDLDYYFGIYADSAGTIDESRFIRVHLHWSAAGGVWQVRGQFKDGTTQTDGTYETLAVPVVQPLYFRPLVRAHATTGQRRARANYGAHRIARAHTMVLQVTPPAALTWGRMWVQLHQTRGAGGVEDYLFVGGLDFANIP